MSFLSEYQQKKTELEKLRKRCYFDISNISVGINVDYHTPAIILESRTDRIEIPYKDWEKIRNGIDSFFK